MYKPLMNIWEVIAPAVPDSLEDLGNGQYIAKWWTPVMMQDIQALLEHSGIQIHGEPYEPRNLPRGLAVHFSLKGETPREQPATNTRPLDIRTPASFALRKTGS